MLTLKKYWTNQQTQAKHKKMRFVAFKTSILNHIPNKTIKFFWNSSSKISFSNLSQCRSITSSYNQQSWDASLGPIHFRLYLRHCVQTTQSKFHYFPYTPAYKLTFRNWGTSYFRFTSNADIRRRHNPRPQGALKIEISRRNDVFIVGLRRLPSARTKINWKILYMSCYNDLIVIAEAYFHVL